MTQQMMNASGYRNIEAEVVLIDADTRGIQVDLAKTELKSKKYQPDIKRLVDEENFRIR